MVAAGAIPADYAVLDGDGDGGDPPPDDDPVISQGQRQALFKMAHDHFGQEEGNKIILKLIGEHGLRSTAGMTTSVYNAATSALMQVIESLAGEGGGESQQPTEPNEGR